MALHDPYAETSELREWLGELPADTPDAVLDQAILAASRKIDGDCGRFFYQLPAATRTFTATDAGYLPIHDLVSLTTLKTDLDGDRTYETTWAATDYDLTPDDAFDNGWPYTAVATAPNGVYAFGRLRKGIQIVGTWGWPVVPDPIKTATLILASRLFKRKDSPFGVAGSPGIGEVVMIGRNDPDVAALIAPYRRMAVLGV
jgi:hypothetical protein